MKLVLATALLALSASAVQADDKGTPDILSAVSTSSVKALNKADAAKVRGEYKVSYKGRFVGYYGFSRKVSCSGGLSCNYLGTTTHKGRKYYVAR